MCALASSSPSSSSSDVAASCPAEDGFCMPAEWRAHTRCWMLWPWRPDTWREGAAPARAVYAAVACAIARFEPVTIGARPEDCEQAREVVEECLLAAQQPLQEEGEGEQRVYAVNVVEMPLDDAWCRDTGPTFVVRTQARVEEEGKEGAQESPLRGVDWKFDAYGGPEHGCYWPCDQDVKIASRILAMAEPAPCLRYTPDIILEGGAIHVDGEGTCFTVEETHRARVPHLSRTDIERVLTDHLGVSKVIWIPLGLWGDEDTNGHVDNVLSVVRPGEVLYAHTTDESDENFERSAQGLAVLHDATDAQGRRLVVHCLPIPKLFYTEEEVAGLEQGQDEESADITPADFERRPGQRIAASYANLYIANNKGVVIPAYGVPEDDERARAVVQEAFGASHTVLQVQTREVALGGGNIHCITQQEPLP